jgi:hypothetical protein
MACGKDFNPLEIGETQRAPGAAGGTWWRAWRRASGSRWPSENSSCAVAAIGHVFAACREAGDLVNACAVAAIGHVFAACETSARWPAYYGHVFVVCETPTQEVAGFGHEYPVCETPIRFIFLPTNTFL